MSKVPDEIKIIHIHKGSEDDKSFIEFMTLSTGKTHILKYNSFINRFNKELINEFEAIEAK